MAFRHAVLLLPLREGLSSARLLLALSFLGFAALGLPDGVLGVAWPSVRSTFGLPLDALGALLIASTIGYVASSAISAVLLCAIQHVLDRAARSSLPDAAARDAAVAPDRSLA